MNYQYKNGYIEKIDENFSIQQVINKKGETGFIKNINDFEYTSLGIKMLDLKKIEKLKIVALEDLEPVTLGLCYEDQIINGQRIYYKHIYIIDGQHRIESRKLSDTPYIVVNIYHYNSKADMLRDSIRMNLEPNNTFSADELDSLIFKVLRKAHALPKETRKTILDLNYEYLFPIENLHKIDLFLEFENILKRRNERAILDLLKKIHFSIIEVLEPLRSLSEYRLCTFFVNYEPIFTKLQKKKNLTKEKERLIECIDLYCKCKAITYSDYTEIVEARKIRNIPEKLDEIQKNVSENIEPPIEHVIPNPKFSSPVMRQLGLF